MTFVLDSVLAASDQPTGTLAALVDPHEVGAAGHSNGAITTLGLVANTCCRDPRVKAAVVLAGTPEGFPMGHYELAEAPPILLVHGTADQLVPYRSAVIDFDQARGPKGLLTINGGGHESAAALSPRSAGTVIRATTDFFDAYLRGDNRALKRIAGDTQPGITRMKFASAAGSTASLPIPPLPKVHLQASVAPRTDLANGQSVTVHWRGYSPGKVVNVLECSPINIASADSAACDFSNAQILHTDPTGAGSLTLKIVTGKVGSGTCDATHQGCVIIVNNASSTVPSESKKLPISFKP